MSLILLVEDDEMVREVTAALLVDLGHDVVQANSARAAVRMLLQHEFDVLVTDIGLPDVSGDVFAAEARSIRPGLGIVFATGGNVVRDVDQGDASPVLLRKPYTSEALAAAIARSH